MSAQKKYYWLRQPSSFFQDPKIKKLRRIAGGDTYTIIYQKIMLLSIVNGGVIHYEKIEDSLAKELALILDEDEDNVKVTLAFMQSQGLMEEINNEDFLLPTVPALIGCETDGAERVRRFRDKKALQCNSGVISCNTEIEKEIELKKEIEIEIESKEKSKKEKSTKRFVPPTLEEVQEFISSNNLNVNAKSFFDYFTDGNWVDSNGNKVNSWKQKLRTWHSRSSPQQSKKNDVNVWEDEEAINA